MLTNRSMAQATVVPELAYDDVQQASEWLATAFGFTIRLRIANHRAHLDFGDGCIALVEKGASVYGTKSAVMVRVEDAHAHCEHARKHGATILQEPTDHMYGERQYVAECSGGHRWNFSQSIADVNPADWGGVLEPA